jgi:hypothetical protein
MQIALIWHALTALPSSRSLLFRQREGAAPARNTGSDRPVARIERDMSVAHRALAKAMRARGGASCSRPEFWADIGAGRVKITAEALAKADPHPLGDKAAIKLGASSLEIDRIQDRVDA